MRGHITKRGKSSWSIVIPLGRDPATGKRRQKWITVKGTKRDAERQLTELLHRSETGMPLDAGKETMAEFMQRWLKEYADVETREKTAMYYRTVNRLYIRPTIGHLLIQKLTPADIQRVLVAARNNGLSETTVRRVYAVIHKALKCAFEWEVVSRNIADAIKAPKEAPHEVEPPSIDVAKTLLVSAFNETP